MALKNREELKNLFLNGLKPNQEEFAALIDALLNFADDDVTVKNGNIGIKTTDPKGQLHVYNNGSIDSTSLTNEGGLIVVGNTKALNIAIDNNEIMARNDGKTASLNVQAEGGQFIIFDSKEDERFAFLDTGRLGIGTDSPQGRLHINGSSNDVVIKDTGKVGIGINDPKGPLHVNYSSFVVADNGRIGVGTSNPQALRMHISFDDEDYIDGSIQEPPVMFGSSNGEHLAFDSNEIQANTGETPSALIINGLGGDIYYGSGTIYKSGTPIHSSDKRLKKEIKSLSKGLNEIKKLKPVSFKWKKEVSTDNRLKMGFIAQDLEKILPELVYENPRDERKGIASGELIPVLVNSIQEQQKHIESLESRIAKLEKLMKK